ncbi:MAG: hypothetical protein JSU92_04295, partial [Deltaproteobacteria bacterium]
MKKKALIIGNSDGIGLELTKTLLERGWEIIGISKSGSQLKHDQYTHTIINVASHEYIEIIKELQSKNSDINLVVY